MAEIESRATEVLNTSRHASLATPQTPRQDETAPPFGKNKHTSKRPRLSFLFFNRSLFLLRFPWSLDILSLRMTGKDDVTCKLYRMVNYVELSI